MYLGRRAFFPFFLSLLALAFLTGQATASLGDHLPDFKECVKVSKPAIRPRPAPTEPPLGL